MFSTNLLGRRVKATIYHNFHGKIDIMEIAGEVVGLDKKSNGDLVYYVANEDGGNIVQVKSETGFVRLKPQADPPDGDTIDGFLSRLNKGKNEKNEKEDYTVP